MREAEGKGSEETWTWLKEGKLKRERETLIVAAQDQATRTNYVKANIDKSQVDPKCRMCQQSNETFSHIVSSCQKLAQKHNIQCDHIIEAKRPDIVAVWKEERVCKIIDVYVPADCRVNSKESETLRNIKISNVGYQRCGYAKSAGDTGCRWSFKSNP